MCAHICACTMCNAYAHTQVENAINTRACARIADLRMHAVYCVLTYTSCVAVHIVYNVRRTQIYCSNKIFPPVLRSLKLSSGQHYSVFHQRLRCYRSPSERTTHFRVVSCHQAGTYTSTCETRVCTHRCFFTSIRPPALFKRKNLEFCGCKITLFLSMLQTD